MYRTLFARAELEIRVSEETYHELLNKYSVDDESRDYRTYDGVDIFIKSPLSGAISCTIRPAYFGAKEYPATIDLMPTDAYISGEEFMEQEEQDKKA